jgi:hypothetical protein
MISLYPGEPLFLSSCKGWELVLLTSPNIEHQVVKENSFFAPRPSCHHDLEGTGRTSKTKTLLIRASPFGGDVGLDKVIERFDAASTAYTHGLFNLQP